MISLASALSKFVSSTAVSTSASAILSTTVLGTLSMAIAWPMGMMQLASIVDNPFSMVMDQSEKAGILLAREVLGKAMHGARPVSLVGWSMGARVIYFCCLELWKMGALGVVDCVYFLGTPVAVDYECWKRIRAVASGRVVNVYSNKDWLLAFLCRGFVNHVAGIAPIELPDIENISVSDIVTGHVKYKQMIPDILNRVSFEGDEAMNFEPPVPETHGRATVDEILTELGEEDSSSSNNEETKKAHN